MNALLTHFSEKPIETLVDVPQKPGLKPKGLWYSVDGDWERWCQDEQLDWIQGKIVYRVDLRRANILRLVTAEDILAFDQRIAVPIFPNAVDKHVAWDAVIGAGYDGIEIAPYQWSCRFIPGLLWYYGFDCASGCVWNASKIRVQKLESWCPEPRNPVD